MGETAEFNFQSLRLLSEDELSREQRDVIVWRSIYSHHETENGEGIHNPDIRARLHGPEPAEVFVMDTSTNRVFLAPNLGLISLLAS